jgi:hypothetical protein
MLNGIPEQRKKRKEARNSENVHFYERNYCTDGPRRKRHEGERFEGNEARTLKTVGLKGRIERTERWSILLFCWRL